MTIRVLILLFQSLFKAFAAHAVEVGRTVESASGLAERCRRRRLRSVSLHGDDVVISIQIPEKTSYTLKRRTPFLFSKFSKVLGYEKLNEERRKKLIGGKRRRSEKSMSERCPIDDSLILKIVQFFIIWVDARVALSRIDWRI